MGNMLVRENNIPGFHVEKQSPPNTESKLLTYFPGLCSYTLNLFFKVHVTEC
jgi:hypothetical protein